MTYPSLSNLAGVLTSFGLNAAEARGAVARMSAAVGLLPRCLGH